MLEPDRALQIPLGLGAALMKYPNAYEWFNGLSISAQQAIIEQTHSIRSKAEMNAFVKQMSQDNNTLF